MNTDEEKERKEIRERYQQMRDDPMTPQYLTGLGQSGSLLDYQESEELGKLACRNGHQALGSYISNDGSRFCSRCGSRVCSVCGKDVGPIYNSWLKHWETHPLSDLEEPNANV